MCLSLIKNRPLVLTLDLGGLEGAGLGEGAVGWASQWASAWGTSAEELWLLPPPVLGAHFADGETELSKCSLM